MRSGGAGAPGGPAISEQERRDRVPRGTYAHLVITRALKLAVGKRVPPASQVLALALAWNPAVTVCDRFRLSEVQDVVGGRARVVPRVSRWSEAAEDIRALRTLALDGPMGVDDVSSPLLAASLSAAQVRSDDQGNVRLIKRGSNNEARDDVAAALTLAAGALSRAPTPRRRGRVLLAG